MAWYIVTDSDWDWDHVEESGAFIIEAATPQEAAQKAAEKFIHDGADGCHMKIGEIKTIGFSEASIEVKTSPVNFIVPTIDASKAMQITVSAQECIQNLPVIELGDGTQIYAADDYDSIRRTTDSYAIPDISTEYDERMNFSQEARIIGNIIVDHLGIDKDKVVWDARYMDDLGADSLDVVELTMAFEEEFGIEIPDDILDVYPDPTVGQTIRYIFETKRGLR